MTLVRSLVLLVPGLIACGGDAAGVDATPVIDIDNALCGDQINFTGEYVDWDNDSRFCGIIDASFVVQGGGAMDTTAPNGRFELCIPNAATTLLDVTPTTRASACAMTPGAYETRGLVVANRAVIQAGGFFQARNFTTPRRAQVFGAAGFDATKAHVLVHVNGTPRRVSLAAAHGQAQAVTGTTWAAGEVGSAVFFPNVEVSGGMTTLGVDGGAIGAGSIPLVAGTITHVAVIAR